MYKSNKCDASRFIPKAACVERLSSLQTSRQILKVISKLLVLPKLNHVIEVLHMLDDCIQLDNAGERVNQCDESRNTFLKHCSCYVDVLSGINQNAIKHWINLNPHLCQLTQWFMAADLKFKNQTFSQAI